MAITIQYPITIKKMVGTWTQTVGSANPTLAIVGTVWGADFGCNKTSGSQDVAINWSQSVSGRVTTITIYCDSTVTDGKFIIFYTPE